MKSLFKNIHSTLLYNLISFDFILIEISGNKISNFFLEKIFLSKLFYFICLVLFDVLKGFKLFIRILSFLARRTNNLHFKFNTNAFKQIKYYINLRSRLRFKVKKFSDRKRFCLRLRYIKNLYIASKRRRITLLRQYKYASNLSFWSPFDENSALIKNVLKSFYKKKVNSKYLPNLPTLLPSNTIMPLLLIFNHKLTLSEYSSLFFRNYYLIQVLNPFIDSSNLSLYKIYGDLQDSKKLLFISFLIKEIF